MTRLLLVDDVPEVLRAIGRVLRRAGYDVVTCASGTDAMEEIRKTPFDVAVVDYDIPGPKGIDVLAECRKSRPNGVRILVSGMLDLDVTMDAVNRSEVTRVLQKPYDSNVLLGAIEDGLANLGRIRAEYDKLRSAGEETERRSFQECLDGDYLRLALQPIVRAADSSVVAYEALLRSTHERFNGPYPILTAAETHGMIPALAQCTADLAVTWASAIPEGRLLFLNLHPEELGDAKSLETRLAPLRDQAHRVVLEITERSRVSDMTEFQACRDMIRSAGFRIALDDLGAGFSTLSLLAETKPDFIKIDMSIVRGVESNPHKQRLIDLICRFGEAVSASVVAEGVEFAPEAETLRDLGCAMLQGYHFAKPEVDPDLSLQSLPA